MDFGKAFTFAFEDEEWLSKLGLVGLLLLVSLILIIPPLLFLAGYPLTVGRAVYNDAKRPLPGLDNLGEILKDGLVGIALGIIYSLPLMVITIPLAISIGLASEQGGDAAAVLATGAGLIFFCLSFAGGLLLALFLPAVYAQYIRTGDFAACFRLGEIWGEIARPQLANILLILVGTFVVQLLVQLGLTVSVITICGPILLAFPAALWAAGFQGHLFGQLALGVPGVKAEPVEMV